MVSEAASAAELEGVNASMTIRREGAVVIVKIAGTDVGELGDAPFVELDRQLAKGSFTLFIDARGRPPPQAALVAR